MSSQRILFSWPAAGTRLRRSRVVIRTLSRSGFFCVLVGTLGYALLPVWVRWLEPTGLSPLDLTFWSFLIAAPAAWVSIALLAPKPPERPLPYRGLLLVGVILACTALISYIGVRMMPVPTYGLLIYSYPAQVTVISFLLGERLSRRSWLALLMTTIGILLTLQGVEGGFAGIGVEGTLVAFVNASFIALYFLVNRRVMRGHSSLQRATAWAMTGALVVVVPFSLLATVTIPADLRTWALLAALALFSTVTPAFLFMAGIQRLGASRAAILSTSEPVLTALIAFLLLGEIIQPLQVPGGILIVLSILFMREGGERDLVRSSAHA